MKTILMIIIGIIVVIAVIGGMSVVSPSINNFDDFVYQLKEPFDGAEPEEIVMPKSEYVINKDGTLSENTDPYTLYDITGLKQIYRVGEPISFTETVQGYANPCVSTHYEILDGNTLESVWKYKIVYPCPFIKEPQQFKIIKTVPNENISSPILNQTGSYILRSYHSYSDGYTVMTFSVVD